MILYNPALLSVPRLCRRLVRQFGVRIIALASLSAQAAPLQTAKRAEVIEEVSPILPPLVAPSNSAPPKAMPVYPDLVTPEKLEEVKAAGVFTAEEKIILGNLHERSTGQLVELLRIYERMGNLAMLQALAHAVLDRVPDHPDALRLSQSLQERIEVRRPGYLEEVTAKLMSGQTTSDPEAVAAQADALLMQQQPAEALYILEKLRELNFKDAPFPYLDSLASAQFDLRRWSDAERTIAEVNKDSSQPTEARQRATALLGEIAVEKRIDAARAKSTANPTDALAESAKILAALPAHPSAIAFRVEALRYAGRPAEATALIEKMRAAWRGPGPFPYQRLLAHSQLNEKRWDEAADAFRSLADNPAFDTAARADARKGITITGISRKGELAVEAADRGEADTAHALIAEIEAEFPNEPEVLGYRAAVNARLGQKDEALALLLEKKSATPAGQTFLLQDTLGDIRIERKEFDEARAAYNEILNDKKYDWDHRRRALDGMSNTRKVELLDEAFYALRDRRPGKAHAVAEQISAEFGEALPELAILRAEIMLSERKVEAAKQRLSELAGKTPPNKLFPAKSSLGSALLQSGQWQEAVDMYTDLLTRAPAFTPYELMEARWERRAAIPLLKPTLDVRGSARIENSGSVFSAESTYDSPWWNGWRLGAFAHLDMIYLDEATTSGIDSNERYEGGLRAQRRLGPNLAAEVMAGASGSDPLYGARFGRFLNPGLAWAASFLGNARSTESIELEAEDAREDRLEFQFGTPLPGPWNVNARAYAKWVRVGDDDVGHAFGGSAALDYIWQTETEKRPEIAVGYFGEVERFIYASEADEEIKELIDDRTNRHGIQLGVRRNVNDHLRLNAAGGVYYAIDEKGIGWTVGLGAQYYLSDEALIYAELRYNSDSSAASIESGVFEANLGASISF